MSDFLTHNSAVPKASGRGVTAVLGPTNTGKTHLAIERMTAYPSGVIGLPLRLLAREVYSRVCAKVGTSKVALITGEEKITPPDARFQVCTVEAMPMTTDAEFVAIDEVQLATDLERGHVFTDRILNLRGTHETMLLGADTVQKTLSDLLPGLEVVTRPRMSMLTYAGQKKITRLPPRSAIVAFSADEVYAIAELIKRQRGGAAVVMGSLSPRTRNAQVALYQSGEVDFIVATDAIGMGLNLDVDHVAFAQDQKFDGFQFRKLTAAELAQIAGRAGRHTSDGTFGVTSRVEPFADELVEALETHEFAPLKVLTWRNRQLDFSNINSLKASLALGSGTRQLMKSPPTSDLIALEALARDRHLSDICNSEELTKLLWDVCRIPDYRGISPAAHSDILKSIYLDIVESGNIDENWFAQQISHADKKGGGIDALSARISQIRTWTYLSNRENWLQNPTLWQERTREVENRLSDELHENLTKRFIDRRTSVLMKRLRENAMLEAEIASDGNVSVEGHHVGQLFGFRFISDKSAEGPEAKAANAAAMKALATEIEKRAERLAASPNSDISLANDGSLRWLGEVIAKVMAGDETLKPRILLLADEQLSGLPRDKVQARLERWIANHINTLLKPIIDLSMDETLAAMAKGIAFRLAENLGILDRKDVLEEIRGLNQDMRGALRKFGVRFGAYHIFMPAMLKPAPTSLICFLWALKNDQIEAEGLVEIPQASAAGRTSLPVDETFNRDIYPLCGFRILGKKAVRIDILERLADLIRPATSWKNNAEPKKSAETAPKEQAEGESTQSSETPAPKAPQKPEGAIDGRSFYVTPAMMSILGATHEDMEQILKGLGYRGESKLHADIIPVEAEPENVQSAADSASVEPSDKPTDTPAPSTENKTDGDAEDGATADKSEASEPKTIMVWRYGGQNRNRQQNSNKRRNQNPNGGKPNSSKSFKKHSGNGKPNRNNNKRQKPAEKPMDPDSPFAKLAALKESMKSK
ncbi:MAG: helicase [Rhizobiaceae bacterium]|nr:helicase [Rhizobiaceae bacterium]